MTRAELAQELYRAFAAGDREYVERALTDDFTFSRGLRRGATALRADP
jgi:hypothetical protein